jgi:hypothetical protein
MIAEDWTDAERERFAALDVEAGRFDQRTRFTLKVPSDDAVQPVRQSACPRSSAADRARAP